MVIHLCFVGKRRSLTYIYIIFCYKFPFPRKHFFKQANIHQLHIRFHAQNNLIITIITNISFFSILTIPRHTHTSVPSFKTTITNYKSNIQFHISELSFITLTTSNSPNLNYFTRIYIHKSCTYSQFQQFQNKHIYTSRPHMFTYTYTTKIQIGDKIATAKPNQDLKINKNNNLSQNQRVFTAKTSKKSSRNNEPEARREACTA